MAMGWDDKYLYLILESRIITDQAPPVALTMPFDGH